MQDPPRRWFEARLRRLAPKRAVERLSDALLPDANLHPRENGAGAPASSARGGWRRFRWAAVLAAALVAVHVTVLATRFPGPHATVAFDDLFETAVPLAVGIVCFATCRRTVGRQRRAWLLVGAACLSWGIGEGVWSYYELRLGQDPFPSLADPFYLGLVPLAAAALLSFPASPSGLATRLRTVLDGGIAASSVLLASWALLLGSVYRGSGADLMERLLAVAYPVGDVVLVAMVLIVAARAVRSGSFLMIAAGLLALVVADTAFAYQNLMGTYDQVGSVLNAGWPAGFLLVGLGALWPRPPSERREERASWLGALLPYAGLPPAVAVVAYRGLRQSPMDPFLVALGVVMIFLVLARQLLALRDNVALARGLEAKVGARTAELEQSKRRFQSLVRNSSDAVFLVGRDLTIGDAAQSSERVLGYPPDGLIGRPLLEFLHPDEVAKAKVVLLEAQARPGSTRTVEHRVRRADGAWCACETIVANLLQDPDVGALVLTTRDVTERKALENQLRQLAFHDPLTGLPNRALFRDRVEHALGRALRSRERCAVLFLDLDNFKTVNDSLGHGPGDDLLRTAGERLNTALRPGDTVARLGGDEFAVLAENVDDADDAARLAHRLLTALRTPLHLEGKEILVQASIGLALGEGGVTTVDELLRNADVAMYMAKSRGKGRCELFQPEMHTAAMRRLELEGQLRQGITRGELVVHYQPVVELASGRISGVEALVRWQHPEHGLLYPGDFVPLAEETGLIVPMGRWVLGEACRQVAAWRRTEAGSRLKLSVNLSSRQLLERGLEGDVAEALRTSGLDPSSLILEITETMLMNDTEQTMDQLRAIRALGPRLAVDDFGTGYSSLAYLSRFPVQLLKIDRSFVRVLGRSVEDDAVVRAIMNLARTFGMQVVAEGVERPEELDQLTQLGCDYGQGFGFAKAQSAAGVMALLAQGGRLALGRGDARLAG